MSSIGCDCDGPECEVCFSTEEDGYEDEEVIVDESYSEDDEDD